MSSRTPSAHRRSRPMAHPVPRPETIEKLVNAVYPSFAMLAGMQLDVFTPLHDGARSAEHLAQMLGVPPAKLSQLLYALVVAGLLTVDGDRFANTPEAHAFLVRGRPAYRGGTHEGLVLRWHAALQTAETIRTGSPQAKQDYAAMSPRPVDRHVSWNSRRRGHRRA